MSARVTYRSLLFFFAPLAATPLIITSTHTIIFAALARLPLPELSIAVFSVVRSFTNAIKAPALISSQISTALADSRPSYRKTTTFSWSLAGFFFVILFLLGYTPLGGIFLRTVMGIAEPEAISIAYRAMRITTFLPLVEVLRNSNRGLLISRQRTLAVSTATAIRFLAIVAFVLIALRNSTLPGIDVAALSWTGGIAIEGSIVLAALIIRYGSPAAATDGVARRNRSEPGYRYIFVFFAPLALMVALRAALEPLVQAGIARGAVDATHALAVFGITWGLVINVVAPLRMLHNCAMVFTEGRSDPSFPTVLRFSTAVGLLMSVVLLVLGATPVGYFVLRRLIAVSPEIAADAHQALLAFALLPLLWSRREAYWGVMMRRHRTRTIGLGKALNMATVVAALVLLFGPLRLLAPVDAMLVANSALAGAVSMTLGEAAETVFVASARR